MARSKRLSLENLDVEPFAVEDDVDRMYDRRMARAAAPRLRDLPIERIEPNPFQPRREFIAIEELAQVIRHQGFTSRLRVRVHPTAEDRFQLVYGERRLRAAKAAGLTSVPCEIVAHSDDELLELGLTENLQRQDLTPIEEAEALKALMERRRYSQRALADRLGKTPGYVQNRLDLLRAPEDVQQLVAQRPESLHAARAIARLPDPAQRQPLIAALINGAVTGDDVAVHVRDMLERPVSVEMPVPLPVGDVVPAASMSDDHTEDHLPEESALGRGHAARPPKADHMAELSRTPRSAMTRILEADVLRVDVMLSRWRQSLSRATPVERRAFAAYLRDQLGPQLDALRRAAENDDAASSSGGGGLFKAHAHDA